MKKCKYYNASKSAVSLMVDDLSLTATTYNGTVFPFNDWGYALNNENSLFNYFEKNLINKYPEIKGTIFFPIHKHAAQNRKAGYKILFRKFDYEFKQFIKSISYHFDFAFHGTTHGRYLDNNNPSFKNWEDEFKFLNLNDIPLLKEEISKVEDFLEIKFSGGKYPGYVKNEYSEDIIEALGFLWWCSNYNMMNKIHPFNKHKYFGKNHKILDMPTNIAGNIFNIRIQPSTFWRYFFRNIKARYKGEHFIQYLYENGSPITIQEHFYCLRTDGNRQTPNIYDDINSLDKIFNIIRGADIWYATCSEIAHSLDSYDFSSIKKLEDGNYEVTYNGSWEKPFLTVSSQKKILQNIKNNKLFNGIYKQGNWIFNNISEGIYKEL